MPVIETSRRRSYCNQLEEWLRARGGRQGDFSIDALDRARYNVPMVAMQNLGLSHTESMGVSLARVLDASGDMFLRPRGRFGVGAKTMEVLALFLRENGLMLADGWNGS